MIVGNAPIRGWKSRLFATGAFLFLGIFTAGAVLLIAADVLYVDKEAVLTVLTSGFIRQALWMSIWTSCTTTALALLFAVPMGFVREAFLTRRFHER